MDSAGPHAEAIDQLWTILLWSCAAVWVAVVAALIFALAARRRAGSQSSRERSATYAVAAGAVLTVVILFGLLAASIVAGNRIASIERPDAVTVEVIGRLWWWEVRYPGSPAVTANEVHIPAGVPVRIRTTSADVIHSVWIPKLGGKIDAMPGHQTSLWIQADEPGVYRGQCAEYCGIQHAHMALFVVALAQEEFERWLRRETSNAAVPDSGAVARGRDVFLSQGCASCHRVRGDARAAAGERGPDLTHMASRRTLAAGTLPNRRGHLAGWIADPQSSKPGSLMPPSQMRGQDLQDLLDYLASLR